MEDLHTSLRRKPRGAAEETADKQSRMETLRRECMERGDYEGAKRAREKLLKAPRRQREREEQAELKRQGLERDKLTAAIGRRQQMFEEEWERRMQRVEEDVAEKIQHMEETHAYERKVLEEQIEEVLAHARVKFSPRCLDMQSSHERLLKLHRYDEAKEVMRRLHILERREEAAFQKNLAKDLDRRRQRLEEKHEGERKFMTQRVENIRLNARRQRADARKVFEQNQGNHLEAMRHAHTMEFLAPKECEVALKHSAKNTSKISATHRGTIMQERTTGNVFALPSLTALEDSI